MDLDVEGERIMASEEERKIRELLEGDSAARMKDATDDIVEMKSWLAREVAPTYIMALRDQPDGSQRITDGFMKFARLHGMLDSFEQVMRQFLSPEFLKEIQDRMKPDDAS